jgi:hypothetical protein
MEEEKEKKLEVSVSTLNATIAYLQKQPYEEVYFLIDLLMKEDKE